MTRRAPLQPWRVTVIVVALIVVIPCGIAAAAPVVNGADLAVAICIAAIVAMFTTQGRERP